MAEFCLDCWNKRMNTNDTAKKYIISRELDLCEDCGEWKPVIIRVKRRYILAEDFREMVKYWKNRKCEK